jgi:hypothetical protein
MRRSETEYPTLYVWEVEPAYRNGTGPGWTVTVVSATSDVADLKPLVQTAIARQPGSDTLHFLKTLTGIKRAELRAAATCDPKLAMATDYVAALDQTRDIVGRAKDAYEQGNADMTVGALREALDVLDGIQAREAALRKTGDAA